MSDDDDGEMMMMMMTTMMMTMKKASLWTLQQIISSVEDGMFVLVLQLSTLITIYELRIRTC